jgi:hypothetical protein
MADRNISRHVQLLLLKKMLAETKAKDISKYINVGVCPKGTCPT